MSNHIPSDKSRSLGALVASLGAVLGVTSVEICAADTPPAAQVNATAEQHKLPAANVNATAQQEKIRPANVNATASQWKVNAASAQIKERGVAPEKASTSAKHSKKKAASPAAKTSAAAKQP